MPRIRRTAGRPKRRGGLCWILVFMPLVAVAQVLSPPEIGDLQMRELQQKHLTELKNVARAISSHSFPYRLYFSRRLDLTEQQQERSDQRSIRFDKFRNQTVVEITANYFASYSAELMNKEQRARRTLEDVVTPMLEAAVPALSSEEKVQAFAFEISHHVRRKVLGVAAENAENVAFILPRTPALRFVAANTAGEKDAALMQGMLFVDGKPVEGWGHASKEMTAENTPEPATPPADAKPSPDAGVWPQSHQGATGSLAALPPAPNVNRNAAPPASIAATPQQEASPETIRKLQSSHQETLDRLVRELDKEAHFVSYAPPTFITFHKGAFLQLSMTTTLKESETGSQYRAAALAFDEHVSHLIRPALGAFKTRPDFDGIDFSTSVRTAGGAGAGAVAVEFIFPAAALACYEQYDCTGQQLINQGFVLINGERVSLDLQSAEGR
jgi:hypothetical protein